MDARIEENNATKRRLPNVGEPWRHEGSQTVYLRINDDQGERVWEDRRKNSFFSVNIDNGFIRTTDLNDGTIQILEPVGGEIVFKVKD